MNTIVPLDSGRLLTALSLVFVAAFFSTPVLARSDGSITSSVDCSACHSDAGTVVLGIVGLETVPTDSSHTYVLTITGGPAVIGGLDVYAPDGGTLSVVDALTQLNSGEITHTEPKAFSGDSVSWEFDWTAPSTPGSYDISAQGVSANDGNGSGGDVAGSTFLTIQVVPIPAAAILLGSALALLGLVRRRYH